MLRKLLIGFGCFEIVRPEPVMLVSVTERTREIGIMVFLMWIGRLEILTVLVVLTPSYWWD